MLAHLANADETLHAGIVDALGMKEKGEPIEPAVAAHDMSPSPALSIFAKTPKTLAGRKISVLAGDGFDAARLTELRPSQKKKRRSS